MDYDPDILLSLEEHSPTPIMASQPPLTSITPMEDPHEASASGDFLPNGSTNSSVLETKVLLISITNGLFVMYIYIYIYSFFFLFFFSEGGV